MSCAKNLEDSELTPVEVDSTVISTDSLNSCATPEEIAKPSTSKLRFLHERTNSFDDQTSNEASELDSDSEDEQNQQTTSFQKAVNFNLEFLRLCSKYIGFPFIVEENKVSVDKRIWKRYFWLFNLSLVNFHTLYMIAGVFLSFNVDDFYDQRFRILYLMLTACFVGCGGYAIEMFEHHAESYAIIWNFIIKYQSAPLNLPIIQTWFPVLYPTLAPISAILFSTFIALNPQFIVQFRFAVDWSLDQGYLDDGLVYQILVVVSVAADVWSWLQLIAVAGSLQHMIFLETWTSVIKDILKRSTESTIEAQEAWRTLHELVVMLRIFNVANSNLLFFFKCASLTIGIVAVTLLLLMNFNGDVVMLTVIVMVCSVILTFYPILYNRAYLVVANLQTVKSELPSVLSFQSQDPSFRRRILSVQATGILVGFRTYERESLLLFYSFILEQVVSIVLSLKE